jgi:putative transcriptional regulator
MDAGASLSQIVCRGVGARRRRSGENSLAVSSEHGIAPGLLLAMPQLLDPNFQRAVVLMVEHGDAGSFGLVLNRPTPVEVARVLETLELEWCGDPDATVWSGGPVSPRSGWVIHEPVGSAPPGLEVAPGLVLSTSPEQLKVLAAEPPPRLRFLMGYAGWGGGQLEFELAEGSWVHSEVEPDLIFGTHPDQLWAAVLESIGIQPASLVPGTGVH